MSLYELYICCAASVGVLQFLMTKLQSSSFASLLMIVTTVLYVNCIKQCVYWDIIIGCSVILVCCSTALLACQMTRFDPVLASVYPLRELCSSNDLHNRRLGRLGFVVGLSIER